MQPDKEIPSGPNKYSRYFTYIKPFQVPIIKTYGAYTFTIIAMIIFIFFAIKPTIQTIAVLQKQLQTTQDTLDQVNQKTENLLQGQKNYQNLPSNAIASLNSAIPGQISLKTLLESMESIASANEASISALEIQPIVLDEVNTSKANYTLEKINFKFNTEGTYSNLSQIIQQLQKSSRLISIHSVIFNKAADTKTLLMSVDGTAYFLK